MSVINVFAFHGMDIYSFEAFVFGLYSSNKNNRNGDSMNYQHRLIRGKVTQNVYKIRRYWNNYNSNSIKCDGINRSSNLYPCFRNPLNSINANIL